MSSRNVSLVAAAAAGVLLFATPAHAVIQCMTVDEFNAYMDEQPSSAIDVTLTFTVTGVNLDDYFNGKGWLAELGDTRCTGGSGTASLKVYGNSDPLNTAHPPGTLKLEYGSYCCATPPCPVERWADPNPGDPVFMVPSQVCAVVLHVSPAIVSYDITCDGGLTYHAEGLNDDAMAINRAAMLSEITGGHAMIATATDDQVCFELGGPPADSQIFGVIEDVSVSPDFPTTVYPDPADLVCSLGDGAVYLKFDLRTVAGRVSHATLYLHSGTASSSAGTGGEVHAVSEDGWSETTLTWNARPAPDATVIGRITGVAPNLWYAVDVSAAVQDPDVYSFTLAPGATDSNGAHFMSKELSATLRAYIQARIVAEDLDGDGAPAGPDCNDADAAIRPGAFESCDGVDNDCSGVADEGCATTDPDAGTTPDPDASLPFDVPGTTRRPPAGGSLTGCGCAIGDRPRAPSALWLGLPLLLAAARAGRGTHRRRK